MILKWWMWQFYEYTSSIKIVDAPFSRVGSILTVLVNFTVIAGVEFRRKHMYNQYDPRMWKIPCQLLDYAKNSLSRKMHSLLTFTINVAFFSILTWIVNNYEILHTSKYQNHFQKLADLIRREKMFNLYW